MARLFHGHAVAMVCRHRWWPVSNWGPPRENHSCSHSTWLLSFALSLSHPCPHHPYSYNPHYSLSLSLSLPRLVSPSLPGYPRLTLSPPFLFSSRSPCRCDIYLPFSRVSATRFISPLQYSHLSFLRPRFAHEGFVVRFSLVLSLSLYSSLLVCSPPWTPLRSSPSESSQQSRFQSLSFPSSFSFPSCSSLSLSLFLCHLHTTSEPHSLHGFPHCTRVTNRGTPLPWEPANRWLFQSLLF